ncbi:neuropeptide Y receptor type 6 [Nematostella vectensis]|uniref:neuropeptide Y receptor type 6 n=1 Tax=Nematostella vectensis TaxID=45351 RepID=UPI002077197C|nr:neuropeptide Y receptor type 6 [Nematostella vectensis]XP_032238644.2 neuropeptide Y receptor type 6 [Nematostella vectensis]
MANTSSLSNTTFDENGTLNHNLSSGSINGTFTGFPTLFQEPYALRIIRLLFQTLLFLGGVIGNFLVCLVTSKKRRQTSTGNLLILHLAISDLGILLVCFPFVVIRTEYPYAWPFGRLICKTVYPLADIFYGVEIGCITAIAFHRYRMLVHCGKKQLNVDSAKKLVFVIWLIAFVFIVGPLFFVMDLEETAWRKDCLTKWPNEVSKKLYSVTSMVLFYVIPLAVILMTYLKIRANLKKNNRRHNRYRCSTKRDENRHKEVLARVVQNRRAIQILTPVVLIFAFSMFPFTLFRLFFVFDLFPDGAEKFIRVIFNVCTVLLMANSSVNPIIYNVVNSEFRREFSALLRCDGETCCSNSSDILVTVNRSSANSNGGSHNNNKSTSHCNNAISADVQVPLNRPERDELSAETSSSRLTRTERLKNVLKKKKARVDRENRVEEIELETRPAVIINVMHETGGF